MAKSYRAVEKRVEALEAAAQTADASVHIAILNHPDGAARGYFTICIAMGTPEEAASKIQQRIDALQATRVEVNGELVLGDQSDLSSTRIPTRPLQHRQDMGEQVKRERPALGGARGPDFRVSDNLAPSLLRCWCAARHGEIA